MISPRDRSTMMKLKILYLYLNRKPSVLESYIHHLHLSYFLFIISPRSNPSERSKIDIIIIMTQETFKEIILREERF